MKALPFKKVHGLIYVGLFVMLVVPLLLIVLARAASDCIYSFGCTSRLLMFLAYQPLMFLAGLSAISGFGLTISGFALAYVAGKEGVSPDA